MRPASNATARMELIGRNDALHRRVQALQVELEERTKAGNSPDPKQGNFPVKMGKGLLEKVKVPLPMANTRGRRNLEEQVAKLQTRLESEQREAEEHDQQAEALQMNIQQLQVEYQQLSREKQQERDFLQEQLDSLRAAAVEQSAQLESTRADRERLQAQLRDLSHHLQLTSAARGLAASATLEAEALQSPQQFQARIAELSGSNEELAVALQAERFRAEAELRAIREEIARKYAVLETAARESERRARLAEEHAKGTEQKLRDACADLAAATEQVRVATDDYRSLQTQNAQISVELDMLRSELRKSKLQIGDLQAENRGKSEQLQAALEKLDQIGRGQGPEDGGRDSQTQHLAARLEASEAAAQRFRKQEQEAKRQFAELNKQYQACKQSERNLQTRATTAEEQLQQLVRQRSETEQQQAMAMAQHDQLQIELGQASALTASLTRKNEELLHELEALRTRSERLQRQLGCAEEDLVATMVDRLILLLECSDSRARKAAAEEECSRLASGVETERSQLTATIHSLEARCASHATSLADLEAQHSIDARRQQTLIRDLQSQLTRLSASSVDAPEEHRSHGCENHVRVPHADVTALSVQAGTAEAILIQEEEELLRRIAALQETKWSNEERIRELEAHVNFLEEEVIRKDEAVQQWISSQSPARSATTGWFTTPPRIDSGTQQTMQKIVEETLARNLQLERELQSLRAELSRREALTP
eukprot:TRINITY_DN3200_c0_g1_i1.p1 TRINITY_DN3200_c0_g1~~TRINITY_DN3200_c0_g1_i1.p1  ORF type:complete len:716 (+),score=147.76 TRINITY_DN3200_c0_g1_i1:100-2247(+)